MSFPIAVQVSVMSVSVVCQFFELAVLQIAGAKPKHCQEHAFGRFLFDQLDQRIVVSDSDVQVSIGCENHFVHAASDEMLLSQFVSQFDARTSVSRSARAQPLDGFIDRSGFVSRGRLKCHTCVAGVSHD